MAEVTTGADISDVHVTEEPAKSANGTHNVASRENIACELATAEEYHTTKKDDAVKIRYLEGELANTQAISIMEMFQRVVEDYSDRVAMRVEREGKWKSFTYKEYMDQVRTAAKAFIKLGLEPYHGVGILGFNSPEWVFSDLGSIFAGGFATGIYTTNNADACRYVCEDAGCNVVVVENDVQLQKILQVWEDLPDLKAIVQYTGEVKEKKDNIYNWNEFMEMGRNENDEELEKRIHAQAPNKCCTLIYTSGTTGNPKGVMLSHDNIVMMVRAIVEKLSPDVKIGVQARQLRAVSYLPMSHIAAQICDIYLPMFGGVEEWFARPDALKGSLVETLKVARPDLFLGVPRVYEKMEEKLKGIGATITGFKKRLSTWSKRVCLLGNQNKELGRPLPFGWRVATAVMRKVHKNLGLDQAKLLVTAAAPISRSTCEYFQSLNLPLQEAYGMSESAGMMTMCTPSTARITAIGKVCAINVSKIHDPDEDGNGELCFQGRNVFMGYLNNVEKTKEAIDDDGWLHTGDIGKMDKDEYFYITGRIKEIIITAGGENVAPVPIEDRIKSEIPAVSTAMIIGDKKKFLSVLLTLQVEIDLETGAPTDNLLPSAVHYLSELGIEATKASEIAPNVPEALSKAIQQGIDKANEKAVSNAAKIQKWKLLPLDFTTTGGELGPTQKLRRPHVVKMYKETIDEFYAV